MTPASSPPGSVPADDGASLRVLVLSKRQYMGRDLLDDRYGRFWELPQALASAGAAVAGLCVSYRNRGEFRPSPADDVAWLSLDASRILARAGRPFVQAVDGVAAALRPHVVWACSDIPNAVMGRWVARRLGARLVIDLYDNFESYGQARIPGFKSALRKAVAAADGVTCVSQPLADHVAGAYGYTGPLQVLENGVPSAIFHPRDRASSRQALGLPSDGLLIGTAGALAPERGTDTLIRAFARVRAALPKARLILAGPVDRHWRLPEVEGLHYLGMLPQDRVPVMLSALNVSVVTLRDTAFGRYCFPQKLYESIACGVPVVVTQIGAMAQLLREHPDVLYRADDEISLSQALLAQANAPGPPSLPVPDWATLAATLHGFLRRIVAIPAHSATDSNKSA